MKGRRLFHGLERKRFKLRNRVGPAMCLLLTFNQAKPHLSFRLCAFRGWG